MMTTVTRRRGKGATPEQHAREGLLAEAINTILTAANTAGRSVAGAYREYDAIFMVRDDSHRAGALLVVARQPGTAAVAPASLWVDDILFLQGECWAWALEVDVGGKSPEQLAKAATFYAALHASPQPIRPMPLILAADEAERGRVQEAWRSAWPEGTWMAATVDEFKVGRLTLYRGGVLGPRTLFCDDPSAGEAWQQ